MKSNINFISKVPAALVIAPRFFGYDQDIAGELGRRGYAVDLVPDRPFDTPMMAALTRFRRDWILAASNRFYRRTFESLGRSDYDIILVINGQTLSSTILAELRASYPQAKFILYMWDSIDNRPSVTSTLGFFDAVFSFDPSATASHGMIFRASFFSPAFERAPPIEPSYDLSFVGTAHTDRVAVVNSVSRGLRPDQPAFWYLYLQARWVFYAYKATNPAFKTGRPSDFAYVPLSRAATQEVFFASRAVLDIEHPKQAGLTMRPFEAMGAGKKLVTTCAQIRDYDFYTPKNICVIGRRGGEIPGDFLRTPYAPVDRALYRSYSLAGWMDEILAASGIR
jgi:hypothetical protein